jgi:NitT/TauT family transport system substrate-binding protein
MSRRAAAQILAGAAGVPFLGSAAAAQPLTPLRLASPPDDNTSSALYGISAGIFKNSGLDVTLQKMNSGAATAAAVAGGAVDLGKGSLIALLEAHARGVPFVMVAGSGLFLVEKPTAAFVVAKDGPIKKIADLNGTTVSAPSLGSIDQIAVQAWIARGGGDGSSVKFVELPSSAVLPAITAGRISGANVQNPIFAQAEAGGTMRVLGYPFEVIAKRWLVAAWFGLRDYVARNAVTVQHFVQGLRAATLYASAHPSATAPLLAAYSGISQQTILSMQRQPLTAALVPAEIAPVLDIAVKYKLIPSAFPVTDLFAPT